LVWNVTMAGSVTSETRRAGDGTLAFFILACGITWLLEVPWLIATLRHAELSGTAMLGAGLSALGPTLAAIAIAAPRRQLGEVFGRWRTSFWWIVVALFAPMAVHLVATLVEVGLGGRPARWFYPPVRPEHWAALVMFSVFEEFGWRGFAYPRLVARHGPVLGCLILGAVWGLWHLLMTFSPATGTLDAYRFGALLCELPLWSVVIGWVLERSNRSMAVAIAIHAGAHLDNVTRAPASEVRLQLLRFAVLAVVAALAARSLRARHSDHR
jgi:membrane protease YdiL (CAAX protease family)